MSGARTCETVASPFPLPQVELRQVLSGGLAGAVPGSGASSFDGIRSFVRVFRGFQLTDSPKNRPWLSLFRLAPGPACPSFTPPCFLWAPWRMCALSAVPTSCAPGGRAFLAVWLSGKIMLFGCDFRQAAYCTYSYFRPACPSAARPSSCPGSPAPSEW